MFTELSVAGKVIASTSNFCSGMAGFAFKLGWHPDYAVYSPGLLNELELIRAAPQVWGNLEIADSGSSPGSFMENIWLARRTLVSGMYATDRTGRVQLAIVRLLRGAGNSFPQMRRLSTT